MSETQQQMVCPKCRAAVMPGARFCASCGWKIVARRSRGWEVVFWVVVLAIGGFGAVAFVSDHARHAAAPENEAKRAAERAEERKRSACYGARQFVRDRLKAPTTAQFQNCYDATIRETAGGYSVVIVVDAQNSYGAMIRSHYAVEVKDLGDKWQLVSLNQIR